MKRRILFGLFLAFAGIAAATAFYLEGWWIPNYPSERDYPVRGIDVSHHQGVINWNAIPKSVQFAYIKATEGTDYVDPNFTSNWKGSALVNIRHGAYHFYRLDKPGMKQAENFLRSVPKVPNALPPVIDLELGGNASKLPAPDDFQRELRTFIETIKTRYGTEPMIYTEPTFESTLLRGFPIVRRWKPSFFLPLKHDDQWQVWQYSERTRVKGISATVDADVFNGSQQEFDAWH
ncbi:MAG: lysozyme [Armatimonadetes bacterium]|nr:lysozyme [Armatimonadota bacterium]